MHRRYVWHPHQARRRSTLATRSFTPATSNAQVPGSGTTTTSMNGLPTPAKTDVPIVEPVAASDSLTELPTKLAESRWLPEIAKPKGPFVPSVMNVGLIAQG